MNSKITRVEPVFRWLRDQSGLTWPDELLRLSDGLRGFRAGPLVTLTFEKETTVPPSRERLAWMLENAEQLVPRDGRDWNEYQRRVLHNPDRVDAAKRLRKSLPGVSRKLVLEGPSHADCLIECEEAFIWVEGKRTDWLAPNIRWDAARDQLARNLEAVWQLAAKRSKDYCVLICYETALKLHERLLVDGYRTRTWSAGWPHLTEDERAEFATRIGTVRWAQVLGRWPALRNQPELRDVTHEL